MATEKKEESDNEILYLKAQLYFENNEKVHLVLKAKYPNGKNVYSNCFIKYVRPDYVIIEDAIRGALAYFFIEIKSIEKFKDKGDTDGKGKI